MSSPATEVWECFTGLFGGDAVARKFGDEPPREWEALLDRLPQHDLQRGIRRLANSGAKFVPALPEFLRMCREVGGDYAGDAQPAPRFLPPPTEFADRWERAANDHLLGHISRQAEKRVYYACSRTVRGEVDLKAHGPTRESRELTKPLLQAKAVWADMMRDADKAGRLPEDAGRKWWKDLIDQADEVVNEIRSA